MISPTICKCGVPWEDPCRWPERILKLFSYTLKTQVFYLEQFLHWMQNTFGENPECDVLINKVLNLDGVIKLSSDMYQTPYDI